MDKRFRDRTAILTYISLLWGFAMLIVSSKLEKWTMDNIKNLISDPVGILALLLIVACFVLFILNQMHKELLPDKLVEKYDKSKPELESLKNMLDDYINKIHKLLKDDSL